LTSAFRLIMRFSKTARKRSIVALAVWQGVRRPVETKCHLCPPLQIWEARIRLAWRGSARH